METTDGLNPNSRAGLPPANGTSVEPAPRQDAAARMAPALRVESAEVTYSNGVRALRATSLSFQQGEFTVLLGASGAGKSTLLRALNGLVSLSHGRVSSGAAGDIAQPRNLRAHRRQTAMVFQQHHLIGRLSVLDNVLLGRLGFHGPFRSLLPWSRDERRLALAAIDRVGLLQFALSRSDQLSGGQQQRVGVARALVQQPRILLADEPVASLDPATAERLLALLRDICATDGLTAVVSLHQLTFARHFATRVVGMARGTVIFDGPPSELSDVIARRLYGAPPPPAVDGATTTISKMNNSEGVHA